MVRSNPVDDLTIVRLLEAGDERGVSALLDTHGGRVAGYLRKRFPSFDEEDVQDALVDAILILRDTFDASRGSLGAWLLFLAHQQAVNRLRGLGADDRSLEEPERIADEASDPAALADQRERLEQVREAMNGLSELERAVIEADLDSGQAANADVLARQLGTTARSIYAARQRARHKLVRTLMPAQQERP